MVRLLGPGDEAMLERLFARHADSSMFLRSNLRAAGLVDRGQRFEGTYAGIVDGAELAGVAAHYWNGNLVVQLPAAGDAADRAVREAVAASRRVVAGVVGPAAQVTRARDALGLAGHPVTMDSTDDLFVLELAHVVVPPALRDGLVVCRHPRDGELDLVAAWRVAYTEEVLGMTRTSELEADCRAQIESLHARGDHWVLDAGDAVVSYSAFNARLPDAVQIGGVFTPPPLRGRGHAAAVVAGQLLAARADGVARAVLFTDRDNLSARAAYARVGFHIVGDYKLLLFAV